MEVQLNKDGDTPSRTIHVFYAFTFHVANGRCLEPGRHAKGLSMVNLNVKK